MSKPDATIHNAETADTSDQIATPPQDAKPKLPKEIGGPAGPEPTRYGDWEQKGRCTDF